MNIKLIEIYTDGACRGNPGPGGWGAVLRYHALDAEMGMRERELSGHEAATTNTRMELMASLPRLKRFNLRFAPKKSQFTPIRNMCRKGSASGFTAGNGITGLRLRKRPLKMWIYGSGWRC